MKKALLYFIIAVMFMSASDAGAVMQNRQQWWKINISRLKAEKERIEGQSLIDRSVGLQIDAEIRRAEEMIRVFESYDSNDGSLSFGEKKFSESEITAESDKISGPAASALILDFILRNYQNPDPGFEKAVTDSLEAYIEKRRPGYGKYLAREVFASSGKASFTGLWSGYLLAGVEKHEPEIRRRIMKQTASEVMNEMAARQFTSNRKDLADTCARVTEVELKKPLEIYSHFDQGALLDSVPEWRELILSLDRELDGYRVIDGLLKKSSAEPAEMRAYFTDPGLLDRELFAAMRESAEKKIEERGNARLRGASFPDYRALLNSIDILRRRNISAVKGAEGDEFAGYVRGQFDKTLEAALTPYGNALFREAELLKNSGNPAGESEKIIAAAAAGHERDQQLIAEYIDLSEAFVKHLILLRRRSSGEALTLYTEKSGASVKGSELVKRLVAAGGGIAEADNDYLNRRYVSAVQLTANFFKREDDRTVITKEIQTGLSSGDLALARKARVTRGEALHQIRTEIKNAYKNYSDRRRELLTAKNEAAGRLDANIAQHEIETIYKNAREYAAFFETCRYAEEMITYYSVRYGEFETAAASGGISKDLEYAVKMNSVFSTIKSFDPRKLDREYQTRVYVKKAALVELSRLTTLINFYRRKNIVPGFTPSAEEVAALKNSLNRYPSARIADWRMTETNYAEVDRKAAKKLEDTINRRAWSIDPAGSNPLARPETFSLNGASLFTYLPPAGWQRDALQSGSEGRAGYSSPDGESVIKIMVTDIAGGLRAAGERHSVKGPVKPVMKKWGKKGEAEYYWFITRAKDGRLSETYAVSLNGRAVIINGTTPRSRYNIFKHRIDALFNSLDIL